MLPLRLRTLRRTLHRHRTPLLILILLTLLEILHHTSTTGARSVPRPAVPLDAPFPASCSPNTGPADALLSASGRPLRNEYGRKENAALVMLARNDDVQGAVRMVRSIETRWNRWYGYDYVFLNDVPFDAAFEHALRDAIYSSTPRDEDDAGRADRKITFATIPASMWSWPSHISRDRARDAWVAQSARGLPYTGSESYHHMCRFNSGFFFDHEALVGYDWYWRLEPDASFSCDIRYDVFRVMRESGKRYGYALALWEVGSTAPSLYGAAAEFKAALNKRTKVSSLWDTMVDASSAPMLLRWMIGWLGVWPRGRPWLHSRDEAGDVWNYCHYWSNFEVADLSFFRSSEYRNFFRFLDGKGGFYYERWGDAPVHSLAVAMLLKPEEVHHFADVGYVHEPFQQCPVNVDGKGLGCNCDCDPEVGQIPDVCLRSLRRSVEP